ncbi:MAG: nucleoside triphosphate pyrophosphohydrolase [Anaerolineales bacterium]|nr:nucleoside triphosphate pyrophosphohydrolase [Anaerolineales bacterium]
MKKSNPHITLLGLGPGSPSLLTRQAWQLLETTSEIYLRTRLHPVVADFPPALQVHSFDHLYQSLPDFDAVYNTIIEQVLALGRRAEGVVYAVPGHPFVAEATCPEIARLARQEGLTVEIVEGLSFLEPTFTALQIDPLPHLALMDALSLSETHVPPFPPDAPALIAQIHSNAVASNVKLTLMEVYPDEHPVHLVHAAGTPEEVVEDICLYEIDRSLHTGLLTTLYLPPLKTGTSFETFQEIIAHLRAPDGCPWDRKQTHQTLRAHLLEETYEALDALDAEDPQAMAEEFGDLLLQIVLHAQIANEAGEFNMPIVLQHIYDKIVRRHPHVFADTQVGGVGDVLHNWERIKAAERQSNGQTEKGLLDGVSHSLPALSQAAEYQSRAARTGFDWPTLQNAIDKVQEEFTEVLHAAHPEARSAEIGDLLLAVANLARRYEIDPESALRQANARFRQRFSTIEKTARQQGKAVSDLTIDEMLAIWQTAKHQP